MSWESLLEECISSVDDVASYLDIDEEQREILEKICERHPVRVSQYYMSLIDGTNAKDPIRRIAIPQIKERSTRGTYDTSNEKSNTVMPGLQHKYRQTALILSTNECATYCRHCFRKRLVGVHSDEILTDIDRAVEYIRKHDEINNVLITGGDPFVLSVERIESLLRPLMEIPHLDFVRFGTRVPVTFPDRILADDELINMLTKYSSLKPRVYVVTQYNHSREVSGKSERAVKRLQKAGIIVSNQTVLLKGVNDSVEELTALMRQLIRIGVQPYYVFQCRPVKRVKAQFQVPLVEGVRIIRGLNRNLDGHSKRFRFIMSHPLGKIEIVGVHDGRFVFKFHQAKTNRMVGEIFTKLVDNRATWLDDLSD
jgi:lysine 2,3-aminomutase